MRPILFLDIDGVLNSTAFFIKREGKPWDNRDLDMLDPVAVAELDRVLTTTDADVVVSSSWRKLHKGTVIWGLLAQKGLTVGSDRFIGKTPDAWDHKDIRDSVGDDRGVEIAMWLSEHRPQGCVFAIVDDDGDMWRLRDRWVHTPHAIGLTTETADKLITLLSQTTKVQVPRLVPAQPA